MLSTFIGNSDFDTGKAQFEQSVPLGRVATTDDIANAVEFLISSRASMITGSLLNIDGGRGV